MNLYLYGHGFIFVTYNDHRIAQVTYDEHQIPHVDEPPNVVIPHGISVKYYCKETLKFDSGWEPYIRKNIASMNENTPCPIPKGAEEWQVSIASDRCKEHLLARPGNVATCIFQENAKAIVPNADGTVITNPAIFDGIADADTFYIDSKTNWKCQLSVILKALEGKFQGTVHWFACRDPYPNRYPASMSGEVAAFIESTGKEVTNVDIGFRKRYQPLPPKKKAPPVSAEGDPSLLRSPLEAELYYASSYPSIEERGVS
jgi:hypothetical protein